MAGTIVKIKQSSVAGRLPTHGTGNATDIAQGELALNTADQKLYSKDSSNTIFEIGGGGASGAVSILTTEFVATASQTSFAVTYSVSNDHINVYFNGVWLPPTDFTATSGTAVVLDSGAPVGTEIVIQKIQALNLANGSDIDEHEFTATAGQTSFTISGGYTTASDVEVYVNGVKLRAGDFTSTSGTVVVLGSAAVVNDEVTIRIIKISVLTSTVSQTSETGAAIIPAGTTAQRDSSPVAGYLRWNSTLSRAEVYSGSAWADVGQQTLTTEQVQDAIGPMLSGNTETGIDVTYDDTNNQIDFAIDSTVATLTGTQTLSAKTLTSPVINTGVSGSAILDSDTMSGASATTLSSSESIKAYVDAQTTDETAEGSSNLYFTNARADARITAALIDEDNMASDSATRLPSQQSVKAYVDSQVTAQDLDFSADSGGALSIDLDSEAMTFTGGTGITTVGNANDVSIGIDATVATLTGAQTLTNKTLTSPVLNTGISGSALLDEDNMASNSATKIASQQSIKAYVDAQILAVPDAVAMSIALG